MLDTLLIVIVFVLSYFSLVRKSNKDRQTRLLDRLEKYLDKVAPETEEEEESAVEEDEEEEENKEVEEREDPLTMLSQAFLDATKGDSGDTEKLVQASRELLKENLGAFMNQEGQKEFAKLFGQLTEFVKL
ncbi:Hypothetical protein BQ3484_155 [Cedratvirus A11]|uniref:Uncharacterized protein n=1 Tax=Cedratvirus A11 TaxID=1903266 RepID=A0A1M7XU56_9VIRU|nr:Hypothetical protein BQ3484_155 [Cedratvirus A11]SHO33223.1 Hypothetical protein BQ3484_155 [Cedratvirus A11]